MDIMTELDMVEKIKEEYKNGDIVMSELLRNKDLSGMTNFSKQFLLKWAGEDDLMTVDSDGNIVNKEETTNKENDVLMYYDEDAIEYIRSRSDLSRDVISKVLELELDYMRSIGLIYEMEE